MIAGKRLLLTFRPTPSTRSRIPTAPVRHHANRTAPGSLPLIPKTFSILVAPGEVLAGDINGHPELQRYKTLFICGNSSHILSRLNRNITELDVRRVFCI